jgi:hypothetical protein
MEHYCQGKEKEFSKTETRTLKSCKFEIVVLFYTSYPQGSKVDFKLSQLSTDCVVKPILPAP